VTGDGRRRYVTVGLRAFNRAPAVSPDGKRIVFVSSDPAHSGQTDLFCVNVDRLVPVNLTQSVGAESDAAWSPQGDRIAFIRDGGAERSLEVIREDGTAAAPVLVTPGWLDLGGWSPDGTGLVVALSHVAQGVGGGQILTVRVPSGEVDHRTGGEARRAAPVWSHDGGAIAYVREGGLWALRLDGDEEIGFPAALDSVCGPLSWTPDNRSIVLTGYVDGRSDICRVTLADSSLTVLTRFDLGARDAALLPDGRRIAYLAFNGLTYQLQTMDVQGFGSQRVTSFTVEEFGPTARPSPTTGRMP
jgi:Tol biopolymer transport system component